MECMKGGAGMRGGRDDGFVELCEMDGSLGSKFVSKLSLIVMVKTLIHFSNLISSTSFFHSSDLKKHVSTPARK